MSRKQLNSYRENPKLEIQIRCTWKLSMYKWLPNLHTEVRSPETVQRQSKEHTTGEHLTFKVQAHTKEYMKEPKKEEPF